MRLLRRGWLLCVPGLFLRAGASAQLKDAGAEVRTACDAAVQTALPSDVAGVKTPVEYPKCDSYKLYDAKRFVEARACAVQERAALAARVKGSPSAATGDEERPPAGGLIVLTELYANGQGVTQNNVLAARFFCEAIDTGEVSVAEVDPQQSKDSLATLNRIQVRKPADVPLTFCNSDGVTPENTPLTVSCEDRADEVHAEIHMAGIQAGSDAAQKDADDADEAVKPVLARFTPTQRAAYERLAKAMQHFIDVQVTGDSLYMGGYGSGGLYPDEEHAAFENSLVEVVGKLVVKPTPQEMALADAELNQAYQKLMGAVVLERGPDSGHSVTVEKLRVEERAWIAYRDAYVAFGRTQSSAAPERAWLMVTKARAEDLKSLNETLGPQLEEEAQRYQGWRASAELHAEQEATKRRAQVHGFFDDQTAEQAAAWAHVQKAMDAFVAAHLKAQVDGQPAFEQNEFSAMYGELYAFQYNAAHGYMAVDAQKAAQNLADSEARLNDAYQKALDDSCLFRLPPAWGLNQPNYRSSEGLRDEQRAWLNLRGAWGAFLHTFYPERSPTSLTYMFTGRRSFSLQMLTEHCRR